MRNVLNLLGGGTLVGLLILLPVQAPALVFDMNTQITGNTLTPTTSWGTIAITDNGGSVNILVDLNGDSDLRVQGFFLNYDDEKFSNASEFTLSGSSVSVDENNQKAGGYSLGSFDMQMPATGNLGFEPFSGTLSLGGGTLTANDFNFLDTSLQLFAAIHIGSIGELDDSIFIGAAGQPNGNGTAPVPEPGTILLLGGGLLGLAFYGRRQRKG
jgi:hypothetical protein